MFHALEERRDIDWKERFRADPGYSPAVAEPLDSVDLAAVPERPNIDPPPPATPVIHQLGVLIRRYLAVIAADRGYAATLALQAPIFGVLFALMFQFNVMTTEGGAQRQRPDLADRRGGDLAGHVERDPRDRQGAPDLSPRTGDRAQRGGVRRVEGARARC